MFRPMFGVINGGASGLAPFGARLIQPGAIAGGVATFTRAQVAAVSTAFNAAGDLVEYAADVPRFNGAAQRLLIEGQQTNQISNVRAEGGASGSPGTQPTNYVITAAPSGLTRTITVGVAYKGMTGVRVRYNGTPAAPGAVSIAFDANTAIAAAPGAVWSGGYLWRLAAGSLSGVTQVRAQFGWRDGGGASLGPTSHTLTDSGGDNFFSATSTAVAGTAFVQLLHRVDFSAVPLDFTFELFIPQLCLAPFIGAPILPPVGVPGASTRGQDNFTSTFASLFPTGVGTVLGSFMLPQNASAGADQVLFDINDGSVNNRIRLRNVAGGATLVAGRVIGGASTDATTIGSMTAGTLFRVGLTFDGTTIAANFNGGSNQTVAGQPGGLTTLRVGNNSAGTAPMFGECGYFDVLPYVIPGANLPAAVSAIP
jgi:hypothetical protein